MFFLSRSHSCLIQADRHGGTNIYCGLSKLSLSKMDYILLICSTPSLLSNGYQGLFPWGYSGWGLKLTTHLHLVPRSRILAAIPQLPDTSLWRGAELKHRDKFTFAYVQ